MERCREVAAAVLLILCMATGAPAQIPASDRQAVPVVFDGKTLFEIIPHDRLTGKERADLTERRILEFADRTDISPVALHSARNGDHIDLVAGDLRLLSLSTEDAAAANRGQAAMASDYVERIRNAVAKYRTNWTWKRRVRGAILALLITAALAAILYGLWKLKGLLRTKAAEWTGERLAGHDLPKALTLFKAQLRSLLLIGETAGRWALVLILLNLYVPLVLSFFPHTEGTAQWLFALMTAPAKSVFLAAAGYLPNLFSLIVIGVVVAIAIRGSRLLFGAIESGQIISRKLPPELAQPTEKLVRVLLIALGVIVTYPYLPGSDSSAFKGISVFLGVLLSLGSGSAVSNAVSGTILDFTRAFREGDRVRIGDLTGDVVERTMFVTRIRSIKNEVITIPNSTMMAGPITNFSAEAASRGLILHTSVTIGYAAPWQTVHRLLIEAALRTQSVLKDPPPFVLQQDLNEFYVTYQINAYTNEAHRMASIYSELHGNIQDTFNQGGVEIMSPHYTAIRDGNQVAIPGENLPAGYEPPAFRHELRGEGRKSAKAGG